MVTSARRETTRARPIVDPNADLISRAMRRRIVGTAIIIGATLAGPAAAFSQGAPICEVLQLPLIEMSPALAQPPPSGWRLSAETTTYQTGQAVTLSISNPLPKSVRGVLLWAKQGAQQGSGAFFVSPDGLWRHIPAPANCGEWAVSHRDANPKSQAHLQFQWTADTHAEQTLFRAFLIENCDQPDCRAHQALTSFLILERVLHQDGFEAPPPRNSAKIQSSKKGRPKPPLSMKD